MCSKVLVRWKIEKKRASRIRWRARIDVVYKLERAGLGTRVGIDATGKKDLIEVTIPVHPVVSHELVQHGTEDAIESFDFAVRPRMVSGGGHVFQVEFRQADSHRNTLLLRNMFIAGRGKAVLHLLYV